MLTTKEIELAKQAIKLHDGKNYDTLQAISMPPKDPDDSGKISKKMYFQMCNDILSEMGDIECIEPIDDLMRLDSKLTLWKVKYSKSDFKAFWGIGIDPATLKIEDVLVQW
jgi:hypothetical protein